MSARVLSLDWAALEDELNGYGAARIPQLLNASECATLCAMYGETGAPLSTPSTTPTSPRFRSRIVMARHGFGQGEYQYFAYPLPPLVAELREAFYAPLRDIAHRWHAAMGIDTRYPPTHGAYLAQCHSAGQRRPTPLLLRYAAGDYNCLHQDLYGEHVFPLQVAILLSQPGEDFTGGEFVVTEQRPRMQSRAEVVPLTRGDAVVFAVHHRPVNGTRGVYRVNLRHGVSRVRSGHRHTLGVILHDAT
ncbi:proline hydroxylase [Pandoraea cepalis]|uniref:Proline hydroxylase n=1 Tax=Pandoraea cepalis TaxID=2508294 RepID=A0AAW7MTH5_9BURK|nr:2OG-Fe(II) oxygenase [Pandoraea cepalis]MDN4575930.1 proline hydroxylase [Pandoraea cepalis]MDN4581032.1 proline hydroxylase [Pandoraea cepalis]